MWYGVAKKRVIIPHLSFYLLLIENFFFFVQNIYGKSGLRWKYFPFISPFRCICSKRCEILKEWNSLLCEELDISPISTVEKRKCFHSSRKEKGAFSLLHPSLPLSPYENKLQEKETCLATSLLERRSWTCQPVMFYVATVFFLFIPFQLCPSPLISYCRSSI